MSGVDPAPVHGRAGVVARRARDRCSSCLLPRAPVRARCCRSSRRSCSSSPAIAACALVGWWAGGRRSLAIAWVLIAALFVLPRLRARSYRNLARGWSLLLAGAFGVVCLLSGRGRCSRARWPRRVLALVGTVSLRRRGRSRRWVDGAGVRGRIRVAQRRRARSRGGCGGGVGFPAPASGRRRGRRRRARRRRRWRRRSSRAARAGIARRAGARVGDVSPPRTRAARRAAGALREFRFNDQLVWGLIAG